jgi:hypothetical protein
LSVNHPQPLQPTNLKQTAQPTSKPKPTQKTKHTKQHSPQEVVVLRKKPKKQTKGKNKE